jgi:zinc transport system ATP-binding protein
MNGTRPPRTPVTSPEPGEPLLVVRGVTFGYDGEPALEDVSLTVRRGDFLAVLGPNGGGKTTLLKLLLGLVEPWRGDIERRVPERRGALGYVPQFAAFDRHFPVRVREVVEMGRLGLRRPPRRLRGEDRAAARRAIERLGLAAVADRHIGDLSGGQLQRTLIARAIAGEPEVLLLDEPLASVDAEFRGTLVETLEELHRELTIVVVTHDLTPFAPAVRQIACINRRLHYHPEGRLTAGMLEEVYGCPVELIAHGVPHRVLAPHDGLGEELHEHRHGDDLPGGG